MGSERLQGVRRFRIVVLEQEVSYPIIQSVIQTPKLSCQLSPVSVRVDD